MKTKIDGKAIVYCQDAFNTPNGKTAHGLVRFTKRYEVTAVIDKKYTGADSGFVLDKKNNGIQIYSDLDSAYQALSEKGITPTHFVIGLAPDGGRLPHSAKTEIYKALSYGLNVDSGLHDFISNDMEFVKLAEEKNCKIRDIRKTPDRDKLHFFTGDIEKVNCLKLAVLGTDSAIGKRTTARLIVNGLTEANYKAEMIGTGQTAWMQGTKYNMIMDSCINDFVAGEIEYAVVSAWKNENPDIIIIEGQGSLMNPAYPGGFEILAAGRPDFVILQHAPKRLEYDGFPGYRLHTLDEQINAIKVISGKDVIAVTLNHEDMSEEEILPACKLITEQTGLPCFDVLKYGTKELNNLLITKLKV
ncbi:MAG: DUF1611 domain-containing protein [Melioribacteraceae bacterium]|nr:DUF1611 domain-containing protein [Melioribacteraceae bacterium]